MNPEYPPYVDSYGQLKQLFEKIKEAKVPSKFNQDFLSTMLGLKSSSYRPMIPFLKRLGFIDSGNNPTKAYIDFRENGRDGVIMAEQIKKAYPTLFSANEFIYKLDKEQVKSKLVSLLGTSKDDKATTKVASTFMELCKMADFENTTKAESAKEEKLDSQSEPASPIAHQTKLGISYTINLNLPATTDPKVFDAIFKSLKEHLLR